jgi:hypothetical protein
MEAIDLDDRRRLQRTAKAEGRAIVRSAAEMNAIFARERTNS